MAKKQKRKQMKMYVSVLIFICAALFSCTKNNAKGIEINKLPKDEVPLLVDGTEKNSNAKSIKKNKLPKDDMPLLVDGIEKITNQQLRITVSQFLYYREQLDYLKIYDFLSSIYLSKHFPDISNAVEYKLYMEDRAEISMYKYLKIYDVQQESDTQFNVEVVYRTESEGILYTKRVTYFFIQDNGEWKYNDLDIENIKVIHKEFP